MTAGIIMVNIFFVTILIENKFKIMANQPKKYTDKKTFHKDSAEKNIMAITWTNFGRGLHSLHGQNSAITIKRQFIDSYKRYRKAIKRGAFNIYRENLMDILIYKNNK